MLPLSLLSIKHGSVMNIIESHTEMVSAINTRMPFGKYAGIQLLNLPEPYLVWFNKQGFPSGKLGEQLALVYEIKLNGLETLLHPLLRQ